jgi:hypothetical protein
MPVESHVVVYVLGDEVEVISEPMLVVPSSLNWTPETPTSSEAVAVKVTELPLTVAPDAGTVMATVGGVVSVVANDKIEPVLVPAELTA